jgi:hypothetical protein
MGLSNKNEVSIEDIRVGDYVRLGNIKHSGFRASSGAMDKWEGEVAEVRSVDRGRGCVKIYGDEDEFDGNIQPGWNWYPDMIVEVIGSKPDPDLIAPHDGVSALFGG